MSQASRRLRHHADGDSRRERCLRRGGIALLVVGQAKCADCTRKNMKAEAAFKGLKVAIKCKNSNGEYMSKAVGELESSGAFNVPLSVDLHSAECFAQLHGAAGTPCPGQEPSRITPLADGSFVAVPGNMQQPSAECASVTICGPIRKHFGSHFPKKGEQPMPEQPKPEPEPKPQPEYNAPTPSNGGSPNPPAMHLTGHFHKDHELDHYFDHFFHHFHKKPVPPEPKPDPKPEPQPENPSSAPPPTPIYHPPAKY
ncbi:hypothetical protein PVAP13_9KG259100 [Panicum virgatum]|uniref:Proline-rich protein n=1 Tax=Panicum virgatum TaxID=38727 RepID=A0A8T0NSX2_PANVG|nr:hypothetical protein PVAP13_9KG259100 [Panicum virgatum]